MRPLHAVLILVALAAVLIGALVLVQSGKGAGEMGAPVQDAVHPATDLAHHGATLDPSGARPDGANADRTKVSSGGTAAIVSGPVGVVGRVVDARSRPVAGAQVFAAPSSGLMGIALDDLDFDVPWMKRADATTDAQGRFTLHPEAHGVVRLAVRAAGFAPLDTEKAIAGDSADVGDLVLEEGVVLQGRVVDASLRPVPKAKLHLARPASEIFAGRAGALLATTDANGAFRIDRLAVGPWALVIASDDAPDKRETGETDRAGQLVANLQFALEAGTEIEGRLVGAPAEVLSQLNVRATPRGGDGEGHFGGGTRQAPVGVDGRFRIGGCQHDGTYRVVARLGERVFGAQPRSDAVEAKSGDRNVVLNYKSETAITCQVVAADDGRPIEKLNVSAGYRWPMNVMEEGELKPKTQFDGGFVRCGSLAAGDGSEPAQIRIESAGFQTYERRDLRLVAGRDNDIGVIRLERSALVRVTVVESSTGAPIAGAQVSLNEVTPSGSERGMTFTFDTGADEEDGFLGAGSAQRGKTDAQGVATLSSLPGKRATISVRHKEHAVWKSGVIDLPASGDSEQTARLASGGTVVVEVIDADKQPMAGVSIDHRDPDGGGLPFLPGMSSDSLTDAAGRVVFAHIPAGKHLFRVRADQNGFSLGGGGAVISRAIAENGGPAESEKGWSEALVPEGETVTIQLAAPELGELTGRVREAGKPLAGAKVRVKPKSGDALDFDLPFMNQGGSATTNAAGEYTLHAVAAGDYRVVVSHPARAMSWEGESSVHVGTNRFDAELPLAIVEGRVTGEDKKPLSGVKVAAERAQEKGSKSVQMNVVMIMDDSDTGEGVTFGSGAGAAAVTTDADGRYRLRGVTPGVGLVVVASGKDVQTARSERIELTGDQTRSDVDFTLKRGGSIEVTARRTDGRPATRCTVRAEPLADEGGDTKSLFTGPDGKVTFTGLEPGRWRITCSALGLDPEARATKVPPQEVVVDVGAPRKVTFDLPN